MPENEGALNQTCEPLVYHRRCIYTRSHTPIPTTTFKGEIAVVEWLEDISTSQGDDRPPDLQGEGLVAFSRERSGQRITDGSSDIDCINSTSNNKNNGSKIRGCRGQWSREHQNKENSEEAEEVNDDDYYLCNPATSCAQPSPLITPIAIAHNNTVTVSANTNAASSLSRRGRTMCESFSSVPRTGSSSQPGGASASRMSCIGGAMVRAHEHDSSHCRVFRNTPDVNSSVCSSCDLWLPFPSTAEPFLALRLTPAGHSTRIEGAGTTPVSTTTPTNTTETLQGAGSEDRTPRHQRIPALGTHPTVPPPAPHRDRCRRELETMSNCQHHSHNDNKKDDTAVTGNYLQLLRLNIPPRLCPPHAENLLPLERGSTAATKPLSSTEANATGGAKLEKDTISHFAFSRSRRPSKEWQGLQRQTRGNDRNMKSSK